MPINEKKRPEIEPAGITAAFKLPSRYFCDFRSQSLAEHQPVVTGFPGCRAGTPPRPIGGLECGTGVDAVGRCGVHGGGTSNCGIPRSLLPISVYARE